MCIFKLISALCSTFVPLLVHTQFTFLEECFPTKFHPFHPEFHPFHSFLDPSCFKERRSSSRKRNSSFRYKYYDLCEWEFFDICRIISIEAGEVQFSVCELLQGAFLFHRSLQNRYVVRKSQTSTMRLRWRLRKFFMKRNTPSSEFGKLRRRSLVFSSSSVQFVDFFSLALTLY